MTPLDEFFAHYYRRRPVNATFTGVHDYDALLPDWSPAGLTALDAEMRALSAALSRAHPEPPSLRACRDDPDTLDALLARDFLAVQMAENASGHSVRRNPSLWTGEAIFAVISLMIRDFAPLEERMESATHRLAAIPEFLAEARATLREHALPASWVGKAARECVGGHILFTRGIDRWRSAGAASSGVTARLGAAASAADVAMTDFAAWLGEGLPEREAPVACGESLYDLLLTRAHRCMQPRDELLREAERRFEDERAWLRELAAATAGSWEAAQAAIAADHPAPDDYLAAFARVWSAARESAAVHDAVTWPEWPIRYVTYPAWTKETAPYVYYLHYRSPAPFDSHELHDYVVPALPVDGRDAHLATWNNSVIKLNHVVHHGGIGHHVQNAHAARQSRSRVGAIAAVDCASRLAMLSGGTMAEGWASYTPGLMDELGFLLPLERIAEQQTRVRMLGRAIVDVKLHDGSISLAEATRFYEQEVGMSRAAASGEAVKNSMFPCTALMYWLGTQGILDLRETLAKRRGPDFSLRAFHDELLGFGAVPIPLLTQMLT